MSVSPMRVPLFWVSIAFVAGCLLGLDGVVSWPWGLGLAVAAMLAWGLARGERLSITLFYVTVILVALVHTRLLLVAVAPNDLRRLPED